MQNCLSKMQTADFEVKALTLSYFTRLSYEQGLNNVLHDPPKEDSAGLHRKRDAGAGAFTYFHGINSTAAVSIPAGAGVLLLSGTRIIHL